jgi:F-type H+-transporting ATPase subunit b
MSDLIHNLGIDWRILIAQIVNFTILLFILKKFVLGPILNILETRRERIDKAIHQAQTVEEKMKAIEAMQEAVLAEARTNANAIIAKAEDSAKKVQATLTAEAHAQAEKVLVDAKNKIEMERERILGDVKREVAGLIADATERALGDVFDANAQKRMVSQAVSLINKK